MKKYFFTIILVTLSVFANAQIQLSDSSKVSLLTASAWYGAVYAYYGHTAILVQDDSIGLDAVFNYGYFDMSKPNFMWHFMRGETDYVLGVTPMNQFMREYGQQGREVIEQELNLTFAEKQELFDALYINSLPENKEYRYNFFYDNCATRPRDMIEKFTGGTIKYPPTAKEQTFRDLVHECLIPYPWSKFGIDLVIGSDADKPIDVRQKMFIPAYLMNSFEDAIIVKNDTLNYPLVKKTTTVLSIDNQLKTGYETGIFSPIIIALALLFITILVCIFQLITLNKSLLPKIYDTLLFGVAGIGGAIIFILMYFSEHPATNPNWNAVWLNIFALIFAILFWVKPLKNVVNIYHFINFAVLTLFLLLWWFIPQQLPLATIPFSMSLWIRSGVNVLVSRKRKISNKRYVSSKYMKAGWGQ
ncbi:MAG: DUF4105 domain-containing protein [Bacteroidia bacterium]|nr:DUF4105 domain-containing protein [Bacteroidia bacterium]